MSLDILANHCRDIINSYEYSKTVQVVKQEIPEAPRINFLTPQKIYDDVLPTIKSNRFYSISLLGPQGTGKTVTASVFATLAQRDGFRVVYSMPEDFMKNMEAWISKVLEDPCDKYCFILDDLSYSMDTQSRRNQATIKNLISRLRHKFQGQIFVIYITHRLHAVPPMLRNSGSWIFSSMQAADREDAMKLIARRREMRDRLDQIYSFIAKATIEGPRDGKFVYQVGEAETIFKWGKEDDPGDGRLMASYHSGDMKIFNSQMIADMINLDDYKVTVVETESEE